MEYTNPGDGLDQRWQKYFLLETLKESVDISHTLESGTDL
jgi:hypothetical protein